MCKIYQMIKIMIKKIKNQFQILIGQYQIEILIH